MVIKTNNINDIMQKIFDANFFLYCFIYGLPNFTEL